MQHTMGRDGAIWWEPDMVDVPRSYVRIRYQRVITEHPKGMMCQTVEREDKDELHTLTSKPTHSGSSRGNTA